MLKTNSKQAKENLTNYIKGYTETYIPDDYTRDELNGQELINEYGLMTAIYKIFRAEMAPSWDNYYSRYPEYVAFKDWASGLAMGSLFCYYYNRDAKDDLKEILQETDTEADKYTEEQAAELLTKLIYRTITEKIH